MIQIRFVAIASGAKSQLYRLYLNDCDFDVALDIVSQSVQEGLVLLELSVMDAGV